MTQEKEKKGRLLSSTLKPWHKILLGVLALAYIVLQVIQYSSNCS